MNRISIKLFIAIVFCVVFSICTLSFVSIKYIQTTVKQKTYDALDSTILAYTYKFDRGFLVVEEKLKELEVYIKDTIDLNKLKNDPDYLARYAAALAPVMKNFAEKRTASISAWLYFDPKFSKTPEDIYFVDEDGDGFADRQYHIPFSYYDNTPLPNDDKQWWYGPINKGASFWTNPYEWELTNKTKIKVTSYSVPLYINNEFIAVLGVYYRFGHMLEDIQNIKVFSTGYAALYNEKLDVIVHPTYFAGNRFTSDNLATVEGGRFRELAEKIQNTNSGIVEYNDNGVERLFAYSHLANGWIFALNPSLDEIYAPYNALVKKLLLTALVCVLLSGGIALLLGMRLTTPILRVVAAARAMGEGDLTLRVEKPGRDEIGTLARSINEMAGKLQYFINNLEAMVLDRTKELEESRNQAQAASRAKSMFLSTVSHEIRTPMNAIIGFSTIFERVNLNARQNNCLDKIKLSAVALLNVINDVLDLSKIESGKIELELIPFRLQLLVDTVCSIVDFAAREKGLALQVRIADNVPHAVKGDQKRISQILLNILNNAVKFTAAGSITLDLAVREVQGATAVKLAFEVTDTGIGLTAEQITRLFQPFSQADSSITRRYGGTGLGLAICKQMCEMMGGEIGIRSVYGQGSTFWFTLVLDLVSQEEFDYHISSHAYQDGETANFKALQVLVVDDNAINLEIAEAILSAMGMEVQCVDSGAGAIAYLQENTRDCVFMDMQMPHMDGLETTRKLRALGEQSAHKWLATVPIIAMTANAMAEDRKRCLDAGMNGHVSKPIDLMQIHVQLGLCLRHRASA